jgi:four helix bundle protein
MTPGWRMPAAWILQSTANREVSHRARNVARAIYGATQRLPSREHFGLSAPMRRAAVSLGSNIAEGCGRHGDHALVAFLQIAMGSASELVHQLELAVALGFLTADAAAPVLDESRRMMRMLARRLTSLRRGFEKEDRKRDVR